MINNETEAFVGAIYVGETCDLQPIELVDERGVFIELDTLFSEVERLGGHVVSGDIFEPHLVVVVFGGGVWGEGLVGVDEHAGGHQGGVDFAEEGLFFGVIQMVDRKGRDDEVVSFDGV